METIAAGCKELTHLEVNGCHNIGTLGLEFIGKSCPYVSISACLRVVIIGCNNMDKLGGKVLSYTSC